MIKDLRKRLKFNKGFSLVELLIVICIIAIIVAVVGAFIIKYIEKSKIRTDVSNGSVILSAATAAANEPECFRYLNSLPAGQSYSIAPGGKVIGTDILATTFDQNLGAAKEFAYKKYSPTDWKVQVKVEDGAVQVTVSIATASGTYQVAPKPEGPYAD